MRNVRFYERCALIAVLLAATAAHAQFSVLYNFGFTTADPLQPLSPGIVAQGRDGSLYTTSQFGAGTAGNGAIFRIAPDGTLKVLYTFVPYYTGFAPNSGLTLGADGKFYGTASWGGSDPCACGTVFKITPSGEFTLLYTFTGLPDGGVPQGPPIQGRDGRFYGTTWGDGLPVPTVYKMTAAGKFTTIHHADDHARKYSALMQGTDGNFYGTRSRLQVRRGVQDHAFGQIHRTLPI